MLFQFIGLNEFHSKFFLFVSVFAIATKYVLTPEQVCSELYGRECVTPITEKPTWRLNFPASIKPVYLEPASPPQVKLHRVRFSKNILTQHFSFFDLCPSTKTKVGTPHKKPVTPQRIHMWVSSL